MSYAPEKNKTYLAERYRSQMDEFIHRLGGECVRCGCSDSLEIDHVDWRTKSFTIAGLYGVNRLSEVIEELKKCQLLCKSCHEEKTRNDLREQRTENPHYPQAKHGTRTGWMKTGCRCEECDNARRVWNDERNEKRRGENPRRGQYGRPAEHGEILMYRRGCKCEKCRAANAQYAKSLREKHN